MSVTTTQQKDFANFVLNHPAIDEYLERVNKRLFQRFMGATDEERKVISDVMANQSAFLKEMNIVLAEMQDLSGDK